MTTESMSGNAVRCGNCPWTGTQEQVSLQASMEATPDLGQRLEPGSVVPAGECPECGALVYLVEQNDGNATGDEQGYNGWPNRATWAIHTHLTNTEWLYREAQYAARCGVEDLEYWVTDELLYNQTDPNGTAAQLLASDLLATALATVDWDGVREALVGDVAEDA